LKGAIGVADAPLEPSRPTSAKFSPATVVDTGDLEMGAINDKAFFKRHKLHVSPNLIAEEELGLDARLPYTRVPQDDSNAVLNPLHDTPSASAETSKTPSQPDAARADSLQDTDVL
jgi:hypothetical protein